ncbi:MAG: hypothetical protein QXJ74_09595 [Nitrososphaera sp.]|uniref:hypothetical protein n=1 Tax=Nitrososphaera sp. TaxID=1971748 RepID=UPI001856754D|nr:hypothetical protein [Nitrososphaera sp.]NWG36182.1 hypothetical protein [Nitrososphaera sp.]
MPQLFGVFATHSPESCPLNNAKNKEVLLQMDKKMQERMQANGVTKIVGFYFSVLEHEWTIILEAQSAHGIETLCIESGISAFNTVKIVPLTEFGAALKRIRGS